MGNNDERRRTHRWTDPMLPASGTRYATLDLHVSYLRPITRDIGPIRGLGKVVSMGNRVAVSEARLVDADDRQLARASSTCLIIRPATGDAG